MPSINASDVTLVLAVCSFIGIIFAVYNSYRNPQIKTDQTTLKLEEKLADLQRQLTEVRETHLKQVDNEIKTLTTAVNDLSRTVIKLSTIIDERIPKNKQS